MSEAAAQVINAFCTLPPTERHAVLVELARISETDAGAITGEDLTLAGAELFAMYDDEETNIGNAGTG
jgi:hypothetical protein